MLSCVALWLLSCQVAVMASIGERNCSASDAMMQRSVSDAAISTHDVERQEDQEGSLSTTELFQRLAGKTRAENLKASETVSVKAPPAPFIYSSVQTQSCPEGYDVIESSSECASAAQAVGDPFKGDRSWNFGGFPKGCEYNSDPGHMGVYYNQVSGGDGNGLAKLLCKQQNYVYSSAQTESCPEGYVVIDSSSECASAAQAVGDPFKGDRSWNFGGFPKGCEYNSDPGHMGVYYNQVSGGDGNGLAKLLCKVAPYIYSSVQTQSCPAGYDVIDSSSECASAAQAVGDPFKGDRSWNFGGFPKGCEYNSDPGHMGVYYNQVSGGDGNGLAKLLCKRT